jgi:hypothetical protein
MQKNAAPPLPRQAPIRTRTYEQQHLGAALTSVRFFSQKRFHVVWSEFVAAVPHPGAVIRARDVINRYGSWSYSRKSWMAS